MRFAATHKMVSYLMVSTAFLVLALSGELNPLLTAVTGIGIAVSFFFDPQKYPFMQRKLYGYTWTAGLLVALGFAILQYRNGEPLLGAGTPFLCWLLLNKMWNRKQNRDYLQAYIISFFMLVSGTVLNNNMVYALCFVFYVVFTTWTLTLFHLRREMEENYLLKHVQGKDGKAAESERVEVDRILNSRRVVGKEFLLGTSLVSLAIFFTSAVIFFLTPRIGLSLDLPLQRHGLTTTGFSDRIELGGHGVIRNNPQVVMRVELPAGKPRETLHFRGVTFDRYEHGRWSRSAEVEATPFNRYLNYYFVDDQVRKIWDREAQRRLKGSLRAEVYLEPIDVAVLFAPAKVVAVAPPEQLLPDRGMRIYPGPGGEIFVRDRKAGLRYTTYSDVTPTDPAILRKSPPLPADHDKDLNAYLKVPAEMPARVRKLADEITKNASGPHDKAMAVLRYLQRYVYTTELNHDERYEPLEDFLFVQKRGHCEYFASAMAILLRLSGVPTRSVNGYLGGEWNEYGHYLVVRQQDAHSWIEAYLDDVGWVTYDPTPASALATSSGGMLSRARQFIDTLELSWFKYIVEYDLRTQMEMAKSVKSYIERDDRRGGPSLGKGLHKMVAVARRGGPVLPPLLLLGLGLRWYWRRRHPADQLPSYRGGKAEALLRKAQNLLKRRGYLAGPGETLQRLAGRVTDAGDPAGPPFTALVLRYYAIRFGGEPLELLEFRQLVQAVLRAPPMTTTSAPPMGSADGLPKGPPNGVAPNGAPPASRGTPPG